MKKNILINLVKILFVSLLAMVSVQASDDIEFKTLEGKIVKLSDYKGKWVIVNYWATWCPPCLVEMPELSLFHEEHKDKDAIVLGVNYEEISTQKVNGFLKEQMIEFPVVQEINGADGRTTSFGILKGLPTTYMVSPTGEIVAARVGMVNQKMLEGFIDRYKKMDKNKEK